MNYFAKQSLVSCLVIAGAMANANVNLDFRPDSQTVAVGDIVSVEVYAVSDSLANQGFSAGDLLVTWDTAYLNPISYTNAGAGYPWGNSGFIFPTLNGSLSDGSAEWSFERQLFGAIPQATPAGLKLTTLRFTAVAPTTQTTVSMPAAFGGRNTRIFDPFVPNTNIVGTRDSGAFVAITLPATNISGNIFLQDTLFGGPYTRDIQGLVKQGTTTVGSFSVLGMTSSTASFNASVSGSYTGSATIEFNGSSFLRRKLNITLNNGTMTLGTINIRNGDIDESGEVDAADIDAVIAVFGDLTDRNEDCDVSAEVDAADIDIVIANFGFDDE